MPQAARRQTAQSFRHLEARNRYGIADIKVDRQSGQEFSAADIRTIRGWDNVEFVFAAETNHVTYEDGSTISILHFTPQEAAQVGALWVSEGRYLRDDDMNALVLSRAYAAKRGLGIGDVVTCHADQGDATFRLVGTASEHGMASEATVDHGIGFVVRGKTSLSGRTIFLLLQLKDKSRLEQTLSDLQGAFATRYNIFRTPPAPVNPRLAECLLWIARAMIFAGVIHGSLMLIVVGGNAFQIGLGETNAMLLWTSLGLPTAYSYAIFAVEALWETLCAAVLLLAMVAGLLWALELLELAYVLPIADDHSVWAWWGVALLGIWGISFAGRCVGARRVAGVLLGRRGRSPSVIRRVACTAGGAVVLIGVGHLASLARFGVPLEVLPLVFAAGLGVATVLSSTGISEVCCALLRRLISVDAVSGVTDRLRFTTSILSRGAPSFGTGFSASTLVFAGVFLMGPAVVTLEDAIEMNSRGFLVTWTDLDNGSRFKADLAQLENVSHFLAIVTADTTLNGKVPARIAGVPGRATNSSGSSSESSSLSSWYMAPPGGGCLLSATLALDLGVKKGDTVQLSSVGGPFAVDIAGLLPPTLYLAQMICSRELVEEHFVQRDPEYCILSLSAGSDPGQVTEVLLDAVGDRYPVSVLNPQNEADEIVPYLRSARFWLDVAFMVALFIGSVAASQNALLQIVLQKSFACMRELGAPSGRVCLEAFLGVFLVVFASLGCGRLLGQVVAAMLTQELGRQFLVTPTLTGLTGLYWMEVLGVSVAVATLAVLVSIVRQRAAVPTFNRQLSEEALQMGA